MQVIFGLEQEKGLDNKLEWEVEQEQVLEQVLDNKLEWEVELVQAIFGLMQEKGLDNNLEWEVEQVLDNKLDREMKQVEYGQKYDQISEDILGN